jgi:hypothetical protein
MSIVFRSLMRNERGATAIQYTPATTSFSALLPLSPTVCIEAMGTSENVLPRPQAFDAPRFDWRLSYLICLVICGAFWTGVALGTNALVAAF